MKTIAILLTVHNRKIKTLQCLEHLFAQQKVEGYQWEVYLTDDACTDGTPEAVKSLFPSVIIIKGDGTLYWNRGMYKAWQAAASAKDYDFFLWLNDDTYLFKDALRTLINDFNIIGGNAIICGSTCDPLSGRVSYSGARLDAKKGGPPLVPNGQIQQCEIMPGNCVLVPREIYNEIGKLDKIFVHAMGDFDYGLRAIAAGFSVFISSLFVANCAHNPILPAWCRPEIPLGKRIKNLYSPLGYSQPGPYFIYVKRHFGYGAALLNYFTIHLRLLFPKFWISRSKSKT